MENQWKINGEIMADGWTDQGLIINSGKPYNYDLCKFTACRRLR